jgi:4-aminobutyrate aminotransferase/(S)-3-amino-2-methylpropionate transaminase
MVGVEFVRDRETKEPAGAYLDAVLRESISRGLVTVGCGMYHNVLRHLIPLVISDDDLEEGLDVLAESAVAARRSWAISDRAAEVEGS